MIDRDCSTRSELLILYKHIFTSFIVLNLAFSQNADVTTIQEPVELIETNLPAQCNEYYDEFIKYDWDVKIAMNIMYKESGCNPKALNSKDNHRVCHGSYGLMQISCNTSTSTDPAENIRVAYYEKYLKGGWSHWSVCKNGRVDCG